jgi:hypothetical protein
LVTLESLVSVWRQLREFVTGRVARCHTMILAIIGLYVHQASSGVKSNYATPCPPPHSIETSSTELQLRFTLHRLSR